MNDINRELEHDDGRGGGLANAAEAMPTAIYDTPGRVYDESVYAADEHATSAARTPGLRCDEPDSLTDTVGHELAE